jgi:hypothetical protein
VTPRAQVDQEVDATVVGDGPVDLVAVQRTLRSGQQFARGTERLPVTVLPVALGEFLPQNRDVGDRPGTAVPGTRTGCSTP